MDTDPGQSNGTVMAFSSGVATAPIGANLAAGMYAFHVRAQDIAGNWSTPVLVNLDVYDPAGGYAAGHGFVEPGSATSDPGDFLPTVAGNNIKATLDFSVEYETATSTVPAGDSVFTYGSLCNRPTNDCFSVTFDSLAWLVVPAGAGTATFQGLATLKLAAQNQGSNYPVRINVSDGGLIGPDRYTLRVYPVGSSPDFAAPMYQASGDLTGGGVVLHQ